MPIRVIRDFGVPGAQLGTSASLKFSSSAPCIEKETQTNRKSYHEQKGEILFYFMCVCAYMHLYTHFVYIYTHTFKIHIET